ncbi:MAG: 2-oxo acid dehydrogenase subunit E2 [Oscillospiraceae bacterium]|nr:2-oxo acid dehydrogenase subunit E2 [Oscillospiraceae bacterium]
MAKNKNGLKKTGTTHFGIQRKIVANMTAESWETIPHVTYNYEPDVTEFMIEYKRLNENCAPEDKVTLNTLMLKIIVEGLKADPAMNAYINFDRKLVRGEIHTFEDINISMPMVLPNGEMMTINLHNFESKTLDQMVDYIADVNRRVKNTDLNEVMFDVSLDNTLTALKQGKIKQTIYRLIGSKTGKHKVKTLSGKAKKAYEAIPETDRLTKHDIEQGTITVSNIGSTYRQQRGATCLLEIVPPQVCAIALGAVQDKPVVIVNEAGEKEIAIRQVMPLCIAFDHRALDFGEIVPFIKKLDEIFEEPEIIHTWRDGGTDDLDMEEIKIERQEREAKFAESKEREKLRKEAEEKAKKAEREAQKKLQKAEKAKREAERLKKEAEKAEKEAEEKAKREAERAEKEAEEKAKKEAERLKKEAEKAEKEAEEKAKREAEKLRKEAEKAKKEAEEKAKKEAERAKKEAEKAEKEAEKEEKIRRDIEKAEEEARKAEAEAQEAARLAEEAKKNAEEI